MAGSAKCLNEENKKLKEENEIFEKANEAYEDILAGEKGLIDRNEELKQFALAVHNFAYGTEWDDEDIVSAMGFDGIIEKMKNDEKREMDENKKLKEEIEELKEENETLEERNVCLESDNMNEVSQTEFDDAIEDKDEEIKKLKAKLEEKENK
jgi:hypothetical protein